jgi:hypothetical protein
MREKLLPAVIAPLLLNPATALAKNQGKLPADAKPMAAEDISKLIVGRT